MADHVNLADPDFEPTDEQLRELSHRAFAHVRAQNEQRRQAMRARIARGRIELLKQLRLTGVVIH